MKIEKILLVDDSPTEIYYLSEILVDQGYQIITANDGYEAIERAKKDRPDMIIMDVVMPGMNGFKATRELIKCPETKDIPIILCTTKGEDADRIWGMRQGAVEYLVKPVDPDKLLDVLQKLQS